MALRICWDARFRRFVRGRRRGSIAQARGGNKLAVPQLSLSRLPLGLSSGIVPTQMETELEMNVADRNLADPAVSGLEAADTTPLVEEKPARTPRLRPLRALAPYVMRYRWHA